MKPSRFIPLCAALAFLLGGPPALRASIIDLGEVAFEGEDVSLADLEAGLSLVIGDKFFTNFEFTPNLASTVLTAADVTVSGSFDDDTLEATLTFDQGPLFSASGGPFGPLIQNYSLSFDVHILDPNFVFDSVSLLSTFNVPSLDRGGVENTGFASIDESVVGRETKNGPDFALDPLQAINQVIDGEQGALSLGGTSDVSDDLGLRYLSVTKDIGVIVDLENIDPFDLASITTFQQVFGQRPGDGVVPEPTTAVLLTLGLAVAARRRRDA